VDNLNTLSDRMLVEAPALLAIVGFDGCFHAVSQKWKSLLGWSIGELTKTSFLELVHPEDVERTAGLRASLLRVPGVELHGFENRFLSKVGDYKTLRWRITGTKDGYLFCVAADVTKEKAASATLLHELGDILRTGI
jgi:PAS domain S-box-containing protein